MPLALDVPTDTEPLIVSAPSTDVPAAFCTSNAVLEFMLVWIRVSTFEVLDEEISDHLPLLLTFETP